MYIPGFGYVGVTTFLPFLIIVVIGVALLGRGRNVSKLVLKEFKLNENENEFFKISGRGSGLLNFLLAQIGINPVVSLSCNKQAIKFESTAIRYGKTTINIPLVAVTGVSSGVYKPFSLLVMGSLFILTGLIGAISFSGGLSVIILLLGLLVGAIFIIRYFLGKMMLFSIYAGGDKPIAAISMSKSIIEGQSIDEQKYEQAADILNKVVLEIHANLANGQK